MKLRSQFEVHRPTLLANLMNAWRRLAPLSLIVALSGCTRTQPPAAALLEPFQPALVTNVPAIYTPFFNGGFAHEDAQTIRSRLPFDSISIRRTACFGTCPVYQMVLRRDGGAELDAQAHLPKLGKFIGAVDLHTYGRLCYLIESSHFNEMNSRYHANWTDDSTCIITVSNGTTVKAVSDYGTVGPIQLWAIQELLDAVKNEVEWKSNK